MHCKYFLWLIFFCFLVFSYHYKTFTTLEYNFIFSIKSLTWWHHDYINCQLRQETKLSINVFSKRSSTMVVNTCVVWSLYFLRFKPGGFSVLKKFKKRSSYTETKCPYRIWFNVMCHQRLCVQKLKMFLQN